MGISQINNESLTVQSSYMAELVNLANGRIDLLFHTTPKNFKGEHTFNYRGVHYKLKTDKNGSICDVWSPVVESKDQYTYKRNAQMLNLIKGNPLEIAKERITYEVDYYLDYGM